MNFSDKKGNKSGKKVTVIFPPDLWLEVAKIVLSKNNKMRGMNNEIVQAVKEYVERESKEKEHQNKTKLSDNAVSEDK